MYFDIYFIMIQKSSSYFQIFRHMLSIAMVLHRENTIKSIAEEIINLFQLVSEIPKSVMNTLSVLEGTKSLYWDLEWFVV